MLKGIALTLVIIVAANGEAARAPRATRQTITNSAAARI